ncbi:MAG: tandem-95 repeat protein, partial [Gammaproteobacteria bacterium]|nr:tandem-95 repeat protein [Gammaproteobacteria bacterium]
RVLVLLSLSIFTISCGGGGGGGSDSGPPPTPAANVSLSSSASSVAINTSVTLTWSSSNASSCTASGSWSGSKATSGEESVEIASLGSNSFTLSCSGSGGSGQSSLTVTGEGFSGVLVDGYIRDANVYLDSNANFIQDTEEASTTTDSEGGFKIGETDATVVSKGGIEVNSNNSLDNLSLFQKQISGQNFRAVTPITSVDFYLEGSETINTILGIEDSMNIYTTDPVANMNDSDSYKHLFEKGSQITALVFSIQSAINDINSVQETSETYFEQLAKTLESQYSLENEVVDIESSSFVDAYVEAVLTSKSVNLGTTNTANVKTSLNSLLPIISVRNETTTTTAISNFVTGKFITDFKEIAKGLASPDLINAYASDVNSLIAADQLIDITDLVVEISLADDSASLDEDKTVDIPVLANDTLLTHTYTTFLEFSSPSNGQAILNVDNSISYIPQANFNGSDSFTYTVTIENKSGTANVNIEVNPINDKPSIESLATTLTVDEGKTEVTSISAIDVDGDNLTYSLSGTDASALNISSSGVITFNSAPDYETKTSYSVTVNVSDGTETTSQSLTITINDISDTAPVINDLPSSISIVENETAVLTVSASDPDDDALTYSLTGTDASSLSISSSGVITFNSAPDFETKTSYSVTVNVSGGGETTSQALAINITNVNDIFPVISNLASLISINEGQTAVVTIAAS